MASFLPVIQKKVQVNRIPFTIDVAERAHQIPLSPHRPPSRSAERNTGTCECNTNHTAQMCLSKAGQCSHRQSAPHIINASLKPTMIRYSTAIAIASGSWKKHPAIVSGKKRKSAVIRQTPCTVHKAMQQYTLYGLLSFSPCTVILRRQRHSKPRAKPSAVFHDTDSICPPTRCAATASGPYPEIMRVNTMEIAQYAMPCNALGIPILQIRLSAYLPEIPVHNRIPCNTCSCFFQKIPSTRINSNDSLGRHRCDRRTGHTKLRTDTDTKNQQRIENRICSQTDQIGYESGVFESPSAIYKPVKVTVRKENTMNPQAILV